MLYIIEYEAANWCGYSFNCVVKASDTIEAEDIASPFMEEAILEELDADEIDDEGPNWSLVCIEELTPESEHWQYWTNPIQRENFYPKVN